MICTPEFAKMVSLDQGKGSEENEQDICQLRSR